MSKKNMIDTSYIASDYKIKKVYEALNQESKEKIYLYDSIWYYTRVRYNNEILKNFFKVQISIDNDSYDIHQRYKNFLYIAGNNEPFGESKGFIQDDYNCCLIYKFDPERTLQKLLEKDEDSFLDDTAKSKTVFAVAAILEYCHALGIGCRFIHPQSIFYDDEKNPFIANIGYSDSILNVPNSTFDKKMINKGKSIFNDDDYVIPDLLEKFNAYSFSADVYAFGTLLEKIGKDGRNKVITNIIKKCHSLTITSSEILKTLVESGDTPLFEGCNMKQYKAYKKRILNNLCQTTDLEPIGDDPRSLFVNASRLLNRNEVLEPEIKKDILNMLISAVTPGKKSKKTPFIPAVYMLANFLESNNDTFIYDINISDENYDPIHWMEIALKGGVFEAPFKLAEMYNRRGLFNLSKEVYNRFDTPRNIENCLCYLIANYNKKDKLNRVVNNPKYKRIPEFLLQKNISENLMKLSNKINKSTISTFVGEMTKLCQIDESKEKNPQYITGKPFYLISVLYRDGMISEKVINEIDGMVPSPAVKSKKVDLSEYEEYKDEDKRIEYLKKSADLLYEPAVAEYVEYLLDNEEVDETKIKDAEKIINNFFSKENCKDDCSRLKIRHAYAKLLEKKGDKKMALRIYKESADRGYIKSHVDYLRLYEDEPDKNPLIIKYYQNRKKRFEETE